MLPFESSTASAPFLAGCSSDSQAGAPTCNAMISWFAYLNQVRGCYLHSDACSPDHGASGAADGLSPGRTIQSAAWRLELRTSCSGWLIPAECVAAHQGSRRCPGGINGWARGPDEWFETAPARGHRGAKSYPPPAGGRFDPPEKQDCREQREVYTRLPGAWLERDGLSDTESRPVPACASG